MDDKLDFQWNDRRMALDAHLTYMQLALVQAKKAGQMGEVPVGAILVAENGAVLARGCNLTLQRNDPTAHAEMIALREGAQKTGNYRLLGTTLYVSVEPCLMCMGAVVHARAARIVFGTRDPKWGAAGSLYNFAQDERLNHRVDIVEGICAEEAAALMQEFFRVRREK
jgi:tRNA(adenine34) deaminase